MDTNKVVPQRGASGCGLEQQINVPKTAAPVEPDIQRTSGPEISSHQAEWPCSGACCTTTDAFNKPSLGTSRGRSKVQELQAVNPPRSPLQGLFTGDGSSAPLQLPTLLLTHKAHVKDLETRPRKTLRAATRRKGTPTLGSTASHLSWDQAEKTSSLP